MDNKQQNLTELRDVFNRWEALLAGLSEAQLITRQLPAELSVKDLVGHLRAWQQISIARLEAAQHNREPDYSAWPPHLRPGPDEPLEEINAWIHATYLDQPWPAVHQAWRDGFLRFLELAEATPEDDLNPPGKYPWLDGYPLSVVLRGSLDHHQEHLESLPAFFGR
jgi:hypothetical protein